MALSTALTKLSYSADGTTTWTEIAITGFPDMGSSPSKLDTTDLSATKLKTFIFGLQEAPDLAFEANYDKSVMTAINALTASQFLKLEFGDTGEDGKFTWKGALQATASGGKVDEVRKMTINCSAETEIVFA